MRRLHYLMLMVIVAISAQVYAADVGTFSGGTGTEADPFRITKVADLREIQSYLHYGATTYEGYYFRVENDLVFTDYTGIGTGLSNHLFQAHFDGNGKTIRGIKAVISKNGSSFGVFSWIGSKCVIKNLTVDSCSITAEGNCNYSALLVSHNAGTVENCHITNAELNFSKSSWTNQNGGLVAYNQNTGVIRGCTFSGKVVTGCKFGAISGSNNGGLVDSCVSYADICIAKANTYVGGITGLAISSHTGAPEHFVNCVFRGNIHLLSASITGVTVGGISGDNQSVKFKGCSNEGTITSLNYTGGIAGYMWGTSAITDCRNSGVISDIFMARDSIPKTFGLGDYQAGICGYAKEGVIERCFNTGTIKSFRVAGGICGQAEGITFTDCYNAGLIDAPYCWLTGSAVTQRCGGLVGYKSGPNTINLTFERCLSVGTVNAAVAARPENAAYVGCPSYITPPTYTNCYYDRQVAGWGESDTGAIATDSLTSGNPLPGYSSDVWLFEKGYYPRLKTQANTDAALAGAAPVYLAQGNNHARITASFTVGTANTSALWSLTGQGATLSGADVTVTRGDMPATFTLSSKAGTAVRENMMSIYPQLFTGAGTQADPYIISNYSELKQFALVTSEGGLTFNNEYIKLGADIDMEADATFPCMSMTMEAPFLGVFDGAGHSLKNWKLTNHTAKQQYGGLFGYIGESGSVSNLVIDKSCSIGLYRYGGTIVGRLYGRVSDCRVLPASISSSAASGNFGGIAGQVEATGVITDCYVASGILLSGASNNVGGIAYRNGGTIIGCQYAGTLTGTAAKHIGGIAADNAGAITDCLMSGALNAQTIVGGIASVNLDDASIANCIVTAPVHYSQEVDLAGAVTGQNSGTLSGVVYDSQIVMLDNLAPTTGITGKLTREIIAGTPISDRWQCNGTTYPQLKKFATEDAAMLTSFPVIFPDECTRITMLEGKPATCYTTTGLTIRLEDGDDFTVRSGSLTFDGFTSYCDDYLKQTYAGITRQMRVAAYGNFLSGSGTVTDPYIIATEADLRKLVTESSRASNQGDYDGMHFRITNDITLTSAVTGISCGNTKRFNGIIHGENHSISNLNITGKTACTGFVGYLGSRGRIENLHIASGAVSNTAMYTGGLVGLCCGTVINCSNAATVTGTQTYTGGLIGYASDSPILALLSNSGNVTAKQFYTGGVAGAIHGTGSYTDMSNSGDVAGTMYVGGVVGHVKVSKLQLLENSGHVGPATTATCNMHGGVIGACGATDTIAIARNFGVVSGGSTGVGGVIGRYIPDTDKTRHLYVLDCLNADSITGKKQYVGGIVGMGEAYTLTIARCVNVGSISNTATSIAAGIPGAGGIMGGGTPTIKDCFNAGTVAGANCIGGILGRVPSNTGAAVVQRCMNTGWLEGYADNAANIGSISGYYNTQSTYTECVYDSCMSNVPAIAKADYDGALGKHTVALAPTGCYPVVGFLANDSVVQLYSVPIVFKGTDTRYRVTRSFSVRSLSTPGQPVWNVPAPMVLMDTTVRVRDVEVVKGDFVLTATYGSFVRSFPLYLDYDHSGGGVNSLNDDVVDLQILPGAIILPEGPYAVYTLSGQIVASGVASSDYMLKLPSGIYVARIGKSAVKVVIP